VVEFGDRLNDGDDVQVVGIKNPSVAGDGTIDVMVKCDATHSLILGAQMLSYSIGVASALAAIIM
jgi:hypothetical protein